MMTFQPASPQRHSILLVEDEAMIAMMLEEFVESMGYSVHAIAGTVGEACDIARNGDFDMAILDCHLEGEEVWPVAKILDDRGIPYILSSGGSIAEMPEAFANKPMLAKPYTIASISEFLSAQF